MIFVKIATILHFDDKRTYKKLGTIATFLTLLWRHQNHDVISDVFQKIYFRRIDFRKNWHDFSFWRYKFTEKIQNDSDIFDVVMTSSKSSEMTSSAKIDDVITTSKMSESFWIFFCELVSSKWAIVPIFREIGSEEVYFLKIVGYDVIKWRHIRRFSENTLPPNRFS